MPAWAQLGECCMAPLLTRCEREGRGDDDPLESSHVAKTLETHLEREVSDP